MRKFCSENRDHYNNEAIGLCIRPSICAWLAVPCRHPWDRQPPLPRHWLSSAPSASKRCLCSSVNK